MNVFQFASNDMESAQEAGRSCIFPAVIVEQVPNADLMQDYSGLASDEETNGMINDSLLDIVEEQVIGEEITVPVEASCQNGEESMETIEAAEALLNMDSPGPAVDERRTTHMLMPSVSGVITAPFTHISMRADGVPEVVENAEHIILTEETAQQQMASESMEHTKKRKGRKPRPPRPSSPVANPDLPVKGKTMAKETQSTSGSSFWLCSKTGIRVRAISNGLRGRKASSSWLTPRLCPGSGANTKTSRT